MKLHSFALSLITIGKLLAVRAQVQATEDANGDGSFSDIWQSDHDNTNMADDLFYVTNDDGAEVPLTTQQQSEWRVSERSTILSNQETTEVNLNITATLRNNSETILTVTEQLYQYEPSRASLMPATIIGNEATTEKTSHTSNLETQRDRLTSLEATISNSAHETSSNSAEESLGGTDGGSTNYDNFVEVTATISDETQGNYASKLIAVSSVSMYGIDNDATTIIVPLLSTEEARRSLPTTSKPAQTTTLGGLSSNAAESFTDENEIDSSSKNYFIDATVTQPDVVSEKASEIATTLRAAVYSIDSDATTANVASASAEEMQPSMSTTSELTQTTAIKTTTARGIASNAAEEFTDGTEGDRTYNNYFTEVTLTEPVNETGKNVSQANTESLTSVYSTDKIATTIELTDAFSEETQWSRSAISEPTKKTTLSGSSSRAAEDFTDGADSQTSSNHDFTKETVTEPDDKIEGGATSETVSAPLASMYSANDGTTTVKMAHVSAEEMLWSTSTALETTRTMRGSSTTAEKEFTAGSEGENTSDYYFTETVLTKSNGATEEIVARESTTAPLASTYSADSAATTVEVTYSSAEETQPSRSTTSEPTRTATADGISSNTAEEFTDGTDAESSSKHHFSEVTSAKAAETDGNSASKTATASQASVYSVASDGKTIDVTNSFAEETHWSMSTALELTKKTTERSTSANAPGDFTADAEGDSTSNRYFSEAALTNPGEATEGRVASEAFTPSPNVVYSVDSSASTIELTHSSTEIIRRSTSTTSKPTEMSTASGISSNTAEEFTDGTDAESSSKHHFPEVTSTKAAETDENAASETATASQASVYSVASDGKTIEVTNSFAEETHWSMSTALEITPKTSERSTSASAPGEFTADAEGDSTSNRYFSEAALTNPGEATEGRVSSEIFTPSPNVVYSVDSSASTIELTHSSTEIIRQSTSRISRPTEMSTASGISSNTAVEFTDGTNGDGTSNHYFTEVTLTEPENQTSGNAATDINNTSLASMHSFGNDETTVEVTQASTEEVQRSVSIALEPTGTSTTWVISSNASEELTNGTDNESTNNAFTEVTLTEPGDQTAETAASDTMSASLASTNSADSAATKFEVTYSSAEETQPSRSTTSEPTRTTNANGISSNTAEEFTDGIDTESSNSHHSSEVTSTTAAEPGGNAASETATASQASVYSIAGDAKTFEVTNALSEETHWSISTTSESKGMITSRDTTATQLHDGHITSNSYFTEANMTDPGDETEQNAVSETVTVPLASMYSSSSDAAIISATHASPETVQRSSSTAAEGESTSNAIGLSSSAVTDSTNDSSTDSKYFTVLTSTDPGDEPDGSVQSQVETTPMALMMSSIASGAATVEVTHASTNELESATNTNGLSSNAAEWSPMASNDSGIASSYFTEQSSTVNDVTTEGKVSSASLASMPSDDNTTPATDISTPSVEDLHWSKTTVLEEKGTTLVNTLSSNTGERSPFVTNDDSGLTEATLDDRGSTIEDFDASVTPTAENSNGLDVSLTTSSNETETTPTNEASSLGPPIDSDTMAEIRRNNSVVVSLSISLAEYTKEFDYRFRSAVADAANDYCRRSSCYVSGNSGGDEGNGDRPRIRRAAVSPAPASPTTGGSTTASPTTGAASATALTVLFTVADVGILPGYPVSNDVGGIDVATYLSPPAGFGLSAGSAKAFIVVSGTVLVAIISANRDAVADALGANVTGIIRLPEKIALGTTTSVQPAASIAASATAAAESPLWVALVASLVSIAAALLVIAAVLLIVKKLKRQGSASVSPSITKLNVDDRPSTSSSGDMWYASGSAEISHARRNRNLLEELNVNTSLWYENSLPQEPSMGRRRVYRIAKDVPTLQYSPPEDTSYFQCISPPPSYSALPPIRNNR